jgi:hypothetical protein
MLLYKNRKPNLKLYKTSSLKLKDDNIDNLFICAIYPFEKEFKIFEQVLLPNISLHFFIANYIIFVKLFSANLKY